MRGLSPKATIRGIWRGTVICALAASGLGAGAAARAGQGEQTPPSLGEIARRLRAQKPATRTATKTWTNDNLPTNPFGVSVVGPPAPPPEDATARPPAPTNAPTNAPAAKPKTEAELDTELADAQQKLDTLEKELDLSRRDYLLQQQGYYNNPMATQSPQVQAALAQAQGQIDAKQQEVDKAKAQVAGLQRALEETKKNPPTATPPKPQENPSQN